MVDPVSPKGHMPQDSTPPSTYDECIKELTGMESGSPAYSPAALTTLLKETASASGTPSEAAKIADQLVDTMSTLTSKLPAGLLDSGGFGAGIIEGALKAFSSPSVAPTGADITAKFTQEQTMLYGGTTPISHMTQYGESEPISAISSALDPNKPSSFLGGKFALYGYIFAHIASATAHGENSTPSLSEGVEAITSFANNELESYSRFQQAIKGKDPATKITSFGPIGVTASGIWTGNQTDNPLQGANMSILNAMEVWGFNKVYNPVGFLSTIVTQMSIVGKLDQSQWSAVGAHLADLGISIGNKEFITISNFITDMTTNWSSTTPLMRDWMSQALREGLNCQLDSVSINKNIPSVPYQTIADATNATPKEIFGDQTSIENGSMTLMERVLFMLMSFYGTPTTATGSTLIKGINDSLSAPGNPGLSDPYDFSSTLPSQEWVDNLTNNSQLWQFALTMSAYNP